MRGDYILPAQALTSGNVDYCCSLNNFCKVRGVSTEQKPGDLFTSVPDTCCMSSSIHIVTAGDQDPLSWDFPGGSVVKTLPSVAGIMGSPPGQGPGALWPKNKNI